MKSHLESPAPHDSEELAGDVAPFAAAIGSAEALACFADLAAFIGVPQPANAGALRSLLSGYREKVLGGVELPAIRDAFEHARRGEARELIELDRRLARQLGRSGLAQASRLTGRQQLRLLRPLKDQSLQRYIRAVDDGEATGWHVVVFGILLAVFSLPLRQGLAHYAGKNQQGLLDAVSPRMALTIEDREKLRAACVEPIGPLIQSLLPTFQPELL